MVEKSCHTGASSDSLQPMATLSLPSGGGNRSAGSLSGSIRTFGATGPVQQSLTLATSAANPASRSAISLLPSIRGSAARNWSFPGVSPRPGSSGTFFAARISIIDSSGSPRRSSSLVPIWSRTELCSSIHRLAHTMRCTP